MIAIEEHQPEVLQEVLQWRAMFSMMQVALTKPDPAKAVKAVMGQFAPGLEGGLGDTLWWEYVKLKQEGSLTIHDLRQHPVGVGTMVISYARTEDGWEFTPNLWNGKTWARPGCWSHWGHMVLIPKHGPDGEPVLFEQCQERINTARLSFTESGRVVGQELLYQMALYLSEIYFLQAGQQHDENCFTPQEARKFRVRFAKAFGIELDNNSPRYPLRNIDPLLGMLALLAGE